MARTKKRMKWEVVKRAILTSHHDSFKTVYALPYLASWPIPTEFLELLFSSNNQANYLILIAVCIFDPARKWIVSRD